MLEGALCALRRAEQSADSGQLRPVKLRIRPSGDQLRPGAPEQGSAASETSLRHRDLLSLRRAVRIVACIQYPLEIEKIVAHLDAKAAEPEASMRPPSAGTDTA